MGYGQYSYNGVGRQDNPLRHSNSDKPKKEVFPTSEIAHLWAHQTQSRARNSQGNFYFDGPTIYSYHDSYPIARIYNTPEMRVILIRNDSYSVTTSGHIYAVRQAIHNSGATVISVDGDGVIIESKDDARAELKRFQMRALETLERAKRSRKYGEHLLNEFRAIRGQAETFALFFGVKPVSIPDSPAELQAEIEHRAQLERRATLARERKAERERIERERQARTEWINGDHSHYIANPALLRVTDSEVITSMGAHVPLDHARQVLGILHRLRDAKQTFRSSDYHLRLGHYSVDSFDGNKLIAGCHVIEWAEIERIAPMLKG